MHSQPVEALVSIHFQGDAILVLDLDALPTVESALICKVMQFLC